MDQKASGRIRSLPRANWCLDLSILQTSQLFKNPPAHLCLNLLDWLNFFDDYTATSTTEAPVFEASPLEFIFGPTPNSEGTRSGQTLGNPLPTFIQSSSDSKESRGEQTSKNPMPTFIESTSSGDSKVHSM